MESNKTSSVKTYKGFDKDLRCRGFQYEVGKEYLHDGTVKACDSGFHGCERPLDVFNYYPPATSRYCETEQSGDISKGGDDSKVASRQIKIGAEIGIPGLVKAQIEYVKAHTTMEHTDPKMATAGSYGAATAGDYGAATAGDSGAATSRGSSQVGKEGLAVARGNNVRVKGGLGSVLVICEENSTNYGIKEWRAFVVDGIDIKADTWYQLKDGEIVEIEEDAEA